MTQPFDADVIVIGSGPGGATTAALLAASGRDVLVLEEGSAWRLDSSAPFSLDEMRQKYRHGGLTAALGKPTIAYAEGRCLGGGSEVNSALYHRAPAEILDDWRTRYRVDALGDAALTPHYAESERDLSVSLLPHAPSPASRRLALGAAALGWQAMEVPRCFKYGADGTARKQSMSETLLPRARAAGARLMCDTRVWRLTRQRESWLVGTTSNGGERLLRARSVFVCAGAIHTPLLLRRSSLAPRAGISLRLHPTAKIAAVFEEDIADSSTGVGVHQVKQFAPRYSLGCSVSSRPHLHLALQHVERGDAIVERDWRRMAVYYAMVSDGNGSVRRIPGMHAPLVRYVLGEAGVRNLREGMLHLARVLFAAGARTLYPVTIPGVALNSVDDAERWAASFDPACAPLMTIHLMGSCPMGEDEEHCVTDSYGGVRAERGLYVNDASLLCTGLGVNPQGTIMAIARRNAAAFIAGSQP